jgi:acetolactate synthase-1/2/3 large subunit
VHIGLPFDVQTGMVDRGELRLDGISARPGAARISPDAASITEAASLLGSAEFPVIVCGGGGISSEAESALLQLAERLTIPVATSISGKGSISEDHPLAVGVVGSNGGTPETRAVLDQSDLIIFVGCRAGSVTTERWRHPAPGSVKVIHMDIDPAVMGANYTVDVRLVCDARAGLEALIERLEPVSRSANVRAVQDAKKQKLEKFQSLAESDEKPIRPERLVAEFSRAVDPDAIVAVDAGTPCPYFSAYYELHASGRRFFSNRAHGALGYSLPAAIGAHYARSNVKCVSVMGDGSFGFCCGELETAVRYRLPITCIVISNASYGWIKAGQRTGYGQRYFGVDFSVTDHAAVAAAFGLKTWRVTDPKLLENAFREAFQCGGPSLVDVVCQPLEEARAPVSEWIA